MKQKISESSVETYLRDQIKAIGGKAYKFVSPGNNGVPDRLVCLPRGIKMHIEIKAPGKTSTPQQKNRQKELKNLGNYVDVIDSKEKVDMFVEFCKKLIQEGVSHEI